MRLHMARSVRCRHFGDTFKWLAYGDDDTFFFLDAVRGVLSGLDPAMPYFLTGAGCPAVLACQKKQCHAAEVLRPSVPCHEPAQTRPQQTVCSDMEFCDGASRSWPCHRHDSFSACRPPVVELRVVQAQPRAQGHAPPAPRGAALRALRLRAQHVRPALPRAARLPVHAGAPLRGRTPGRALPARQSAPSHCLGHLL